MSFILRPPDFEIVQSVFGKLIQSDWFDRTDANEKACAQLVLVLYGDGGLSVDQLHAKCVETAQELFSDSQRTTAQRRVP